MQREPPLRAPLPTRRLLSTMDCQDDNLFRCRSKIDRVRKTSQNPSPSLAAHTPKSQRVFNDPSNKRLHFCGELTAEALASPIVPTPNVQHFVFGFRSKYRFECHPRPKSFRWTSDHGTADPGFARCSAHRRSSSAPCSSVGASSPSRSALERLSQSAMANSARSPAGSLNSRDNVLDSMR